MGNPARLDGWGKFWMLRPGTTGRLGKNDHWQIWDMRALWEANRAETSFGIEQGCVVGRGETAEEAVQDALMWQALLQQNRSQAGPG